MTESRENPKENGDHTAIEPQGLSNLQVLKNSVFIFHGPNGAGKTTTIKLILDPTRPTSYSGTILAHDLTKENEKNMI
jgi:ABC-type multidrug transport system ATPase subunit